MKKSANCIIPFCLAVVVLMTLLTGCIYRPFVIGPEVGIREVSYFPKYFCSGEKIYFSYEAININKLQILKSDGSVLLEMLGDTGSNESPPMQAQWLPLSVKVLTDYGDKSESLAGKIVNIDNPTWAGPFLSVIELREGDPIFEHIASVEEWDTETSAIVTVKIYKVWQDFIGLEWQIPILEFSPKAALLSARNDGNERMSFGLPGDWVQLSPGQTAPIENYPYPPVWIKANYLSPKRKLIAIQKGEYTKPENEHFNYQNLYQTPGYPLSLEIVCK
jgi:hypothetical protein